MIKASKHKNSASNLKTNQKSIEKPKWKSNLVIIFLSVFFSCSMQQPVQKQEEVKHKYPPTNPYPTVMKTIKTSHLLALQVELESASLEFDCTLRNDSPYYWCGVSGLIVNPDPNLPSKVGVFFHRVVNKKGKEIARRFVNRLKKSQQKVKLVTPLGYHIENKEFGNAMFGLYNDLECMDLFHDFSSYCPQTAKKLNVFTGEYENE